MVPTSPQLLADQMLFRQMLEQMPQAVSLLYGPHLVITATNAAQLSMWQKSRDEVMGQAFV